MKILGMIMMQNNNNNMKRMFFIVALFMATVSSATTPIDSARSYVNSNIVTNGSKAITGLKMNTALNGIIDAIDSTKVVLGVAINTLRKVDTIYTNTGADSLVYKISGVRYAIASGGGGVALSGITAATAVNTINNGDKTQTWTWNSLSGQSGLKLSSTANGTTSNKTQKLFESVLTGAMVNTSNTSYAGYFDNQQTIGGAYGIYARGYVAAQLEGIVNINGVLNVNNLKISNDNGGATYITPLQNQALTIGRGNNITYFGLSGIYEGMVISTKTSGSSYFMGLGGSTYQSNQYLSAFTTATFLEKNSDKLQFSANAGLSGNYNSFSPTYQVTIAGATNNVGIGTITPNVSAKLDVSSTTQGFAPPEMTATQASAISTTSRKLIIYVTSTNGTFTSAGLWMWNGTAWKLILAE